MMYTVEHKNKPSRLVKFFRLLGLLLYLKHCGIIKKK